MRRSVTTSQECWIGPSTYLVVIIVVGRHGEANSQWTRSPAAGRTEQRGSPGHQLCCAAEMSSRSKGGMDGSGGGSEEHDPFGRSKRVWKVEGGEEHDGVSRDGIIASAPVVPCDRPCPLRGRRGTTPPALLGLAALGPNYSGFQGHALTFGLTF